jgi:replication factor C subunit 3/5
MEINQPYMESIPWIEKYRPVHFENIVLDPYNRKIFDNILSTWHFPNLLFYGPPGTGKTTTIINLINKWQVNSEKRTQKENVIHLNASDERGIDIIRNQINQFIKSRNLFEKGMKFVILDEVDYMTKNAQQALKTLLQTEKCNIRFCLICNYISKIDESLQNEFLCIRFNQLPKQEIFSFIKHISIQEKLELSDENVERIMLLFHSDIRSMINFMQLNLLQNKNEIPKIICKEIWDKLFSLLISINDTQSNKDSVMDYLQEISIEYNIDKINLINMFFLYMQKYHKKMITPRLLFYFEAIFHCSDNYIYSILNYFYWALYECKESSNKNEDSLIKNV